MEIKEIKEDIKEKLSNKRYIHSIGTAKMAKELALIYGEDEKKAEFAGLIHDIAKEMNKEEIEEYLELHNIEIDEIEQKQLALLHAKLGASIAKEKYNADIEVQNAIMYHTTGNKKMNKFAKIIYIADKIEENRDYDDVEDVRKIAKQDLDDAMLYILNFVIQKSIKKERLIHPDTIHTRNEIISNKIGLKY